jgi:uncharacterized protein YifE (UPF0438 family)
MNKNSIGHNLKRQIKRYIEKKMQDFAKSKGRFLFDMIFGIVKSGDCKISNIGRALNEKKDLCHTIKRLYNNVNNYDYCSEIENALISSYQEFSSSTILSLDFSDITKPYAQKMENLSTVRDGDKGTLGNGYNQVVVTATELGEENPSILANSLFSKKANPGVTSTDAALDILKKVTNFYGNKGIHTQDRYFDNKHFYRYFIANDQSFVTRAKVNRKLLKVNSSGRVLPEKVSILTLAKNCRTPHKYVTKIWENGKWQERKQVRIGSRKVFLPCINLIVTMVVIKGFGTKPMMLLTNIDVNPRNESNVLKIYRIYRARWKCEEWIRYIKTEYNLEDIRALNWVSIKNIVSFVNFAVTFIVRRLGYSPQLRIAREKLKRISKPIYFEKAKMTLYMLSSGIKEALKDISAEFRELRKEMDSDIQLELDL